MLDPKSVADLHRRCHASLTLMLNHCRGLSSDQLHQQLDGFGFPSIQSQLFHIIECEDWWVDGVTGNVRPPQSKDDYPDIDKLTSYQHEVMQITLAYLESVSIKGYNAEQVVHAGEESERLLIPARVIHHIQTHAFHHKGQIAAMCRLLGHPAPETDLPMRD